MFGTTGNRYYYLNCNAENFVERAQAKYPELKFSDDPVLGAIMCWRKGGLGSSDGAGHVEFVEKVIDNNTVVTTASNYGGTAFYTSTRKRNSGNGWGLGSPYAFRYFIYNPDMVIKVPLPVDRDEWVDQLEVLDGDYIVTYNSVRYREKIVYFDDTIKYGKWSIPKSENINKRLNYDLIKKREEEKRERERKEKIERENEEEKRRRQREEEELRNKIKNVSEYDYYDPPVHRNNNFDRIFSSMNNVSFPIYRREFGGGSGTFSVNVGCNII